MFIVSERLLTFEHFANFQNFTKRIFFMLYTCAEESDSDATISRKCRYVLKVHANERLSCGEFYFNESVTFDILTSLAFSIFTCFIPINFSKFKVLFLSVTK